MMEELYGFRCTVDYSDRNSPVVLPLDYHAFDASASVPMHIPILGSSEQMFSVSSAVSDAASVQKSGTEDKFSSSIRAKIASHPLYPKLLEAYIECQKIGAPSDIANLFDEIRREDFSRRYSVSTCLGNDPELDEFMETYCELLVKYKSDLSRPFNEATSFLNNIETQLRNLCNGASRSCISDEAVGSSEEDIHAGEINMQEFKHTSEDQELKEELFRKYSGYISSLKHEFSKKKRKAKLPREARQVLLDWWTIHYKWPYPTEADKVALAESTGLDQKQINNWFINQRKRHWRPSENMQFDVMESVYGPLFTNN